VKGPSGCAVRQNSESGPVQGLIVLKLAYKEEGKFWDWIFGKFPDGTLAGVRTRWTMVQRRVDKLPPAGGQAAAQALCAYLSQGICWDECLMRSCSLCWPVEGNGEAGFKAREDKGSSA